MKKEFAKYLLEKTTKDYDLIAQDYARTRGFFWDIKELSEYVLPGKKILDLGCGNGRLFEIFKNIDVDYIGVDASEKLIEIAKQKYPKLKFQTADALNLPFPNQYFDKVFSIRVFHHFPSKEFRAQFLQEVKRVLKPKGILILTVWNAQGCKDKTNLFRVFKNSLLKIVGMSKLDFGDAMIPWGKQASRYYHFFTKNELRKLVKENGFKIKKIWTTSRERNFSDIYIVVEKQ